MTLSTGVKKVVSYKKETNWGELAGPTAGKQLRRVTADFNLNKESYESSEIRTDYQVADFRHGIRSADGSLNGELSPNTYSDFMQAVLARDFAVVTLGAAAQMTVTVVGGVTKLVRATGSFLTDGVRVGMVIRASGLTAVADNGKNLLVAAVTALEVTVVPLNGLTMTAQGVATSVTLTAPGRRTFVPLTGHTDQSFTIENWFADIAQSEVFTGMKVGTMNVQLPASGLTTVDFSFMGKDLTSKGTTQYFTTPTAQGTDGIFASVNGALVVNGVAIALVTSLDFSVERGMENATAVGSNSVADIFTGRIRATGNMSVYFMDSSFRDMFDAETPVSLAVALTTTSAANSAFVSFTLPKIKINSHSIADGEMGLTASASFQALLSDLPGTEATTIAVQDSTLV
jgi:hypothetical protein